jgi:DNA-binding NarL/FixJ family response regulator
MIKVLVADDHAVVRHGLGLLIGRTQDIVVAGMAENGDKVLEALRQGEFDLLLLDLTMPGPSGPELVDLIRKEYAALPILVFSMRSELHMAKRMLHKGVAGYATKGCDETLLIAAIRKVASGGRFVDPSISGQVMFEEEASANPVSTERLSERELQIMKLFAQGKNLTEIAGELEISPKSVSTYKTRLMKKMDFKSNSELAIYAAEYGLIEKS